MIIDGDHNYFTVSEELRLVAERAAVTGRMPLILLHDIGWPLARRDSYHAPERIPAEHRQPLAEPALLVPGEPGAGERGLYYRSAAAHEGGPRNGVLTAVEDFLADRDELRLAIMPPFFGLGVVWDTRAPRRRRDRERRRALGPQSAADPGRGKARRAPRRRVHATCRRSTRCEARTTSFSTCSSTMLESSAFALAERLSGLRQGGKPMFTRAQVEAALARSREDNDLLGDAQRRAAETNGRSNGHAHDQRGRS